ncbi:MAG: hypothetical protein R2681_10055 [Pyrinomonadaceae bacterium]
MFFLFLKLSEAVWILFLMFFAAIVPVAVIAGTLFFVFRRNSKSRAAWGNVARALNFHMPRPKELLMTGDVDGSDVKAAIRVERDYSGEHTRVKFFTYCTSEFSRPLRFLLDVNSDKSFFRRSSKMPIGEPNFDNVFNAQCYDPNVLRRLLLSDFSSDKTQNLYGDLMLAKQTAGTVRVSDRRVYLERSGQISDETVLREMIFATARLAKRFEAARKIFPLADWEKQLMNSWQKFAAVNGLVFNTDFFQIQGIYKGFPVFVELETDAAKWETQIKMKFPRNLAIGFKLMPENSVHKALTWIGVQDIEVGIKGFDDIFIIKANNVEAAKRKLAPDLCSLLIGINNNASAIAIDDNELSVTYKTVLGDPQLLKETLDAVSAASHMLMR